MSAKNLSQKLSDMKKMLATSRAVMQETAKEYFEAMSKEIFETHPVLVSFSWAQFTPYFNDGDECTFGARTDEIDITFKNNEGEEIEEEYVGRNHWSRVWDGHQYNERPLTGDLKAFTAAANDVLDFLREFDDADLKEMFGDHMRVTVTADGVETDEYSHD